MYDNPVALSTTPGVLILTASAVQDNYGILAGFGIGLDFALGAGVFIATHVAGNQVKAGWERAGPMRSSISAHLKLYCTHTHCSSSVSCTVGCSADSSSMVLAFSSGTILRSGDMLRSAQRPER